MSNILFSVGRQAHPSCASVDNLIYFSLKSDESHVTSNLEQKAQLEQRLVLVLWISCTRHVLASACLLCKTKPSSNRTQYKYIVWIVGI